jgi:hypothetical protein
MKDNDIEQTKNKYYIKYIWKNIIYISEDEKEKSSNSIMINSVINFKTSRLTLLWLLLLWLFSRVVAASSATLIYEFGITISI